MKKADLQSFGAIAVTLLVAAGIGWAGSQDGRLFEGVPLFAVLGLVAFLIQWMVFVPSYIAQTEHYFDLTGSLTYLLLVVLAVLFSGATDTRSLVLAALVAVWALRLGSFLFLRVKQQGADRRFDKIKPSFPRFLMTWTLQGLWVFLTLSAALVAITSRYQAPMEWIGLLGMLVFTVGFVIEVVADRQKSQFRADPANEGAFIRSGLWAWSRHPNYFGEITLWVGIFMIAAPVLVGWHWVTVLSPLFVFVLLTRISGVPMLEARARKRWGNDPEFQDYVARTPVLVPRPPKQR